MDDLQNGYTHLTPEILVPRLGDYLVEIKLISPQDLQTALQAQDALRNSQAEVPLLGQVLIDLNRISQADLDRAITEYVLQLRNALETTNHQLEQRVKERTAELETALQKLSELNQLKANFVANISHELRTPLTHLKGYQELLLSQDIGPITDSQQSALLTMQKATDRLERLIEDLILFSTSERNRIPLKIEQIDLVAVCSEAAGQLLTKAQERQLTLSTQVDSAPILVPADREKIGWVIHQLLDNAIKFSPIGGKIILHISQDDRQVFVQVIDSGIGIPAHRVIELFEPFHQLDGSSTRKYGGTGLGLSLAQKIIEAHGSHFEVESDLGKGSSFSFQLNKKPT